MSIRYPISAGFHLLRDITDPESSALYHPQIVTIKIGPDSREFTVPRPLLCGLSAYFDKAFSTNFAKARPVASLFQM